MNWDDLRILRAVGSNGSFSAAARKLGITHSTVSRRIRALQDQLEVALVEHTSDGLVLTPAGEDLFAASAKMGDEADAVELRLIGRDAQLEGSIRLSVVDATARNLMPSFRAFLDRYPGIELDVDIGQGLASVSRREADVILRATNNPPETLIGRRLADHRFPVYCAPSLLAETGEDTPLSEFPWVIWANGMMDPWMERHAPGARVACRMSSALAMDEAVRAGIGVGHLACYGVDRDPGFVRVYPANDDFNLGIWLLTHRDLRKSARIRAFTEFIGAQVTGQKDLIEGREPLSDGYCLSL